MVTRGARHVGGWLLWAVCAVLVACGPSGEANTRGAHAVCPDTPGAATHVEEDGLPVFHLFFPGSLPDEKGYHAARLVYRGRCYPLEARLRGDTSAKFPKRSYTLKFPEDAPFDEPSLAGGFTGRRKVVLISPFNDNSYLRSRLAFELWNRMSPDHIPVKTYSAVVYLNGRYWGLYTVADHLNRHLLAEYGLDGAGDLYKAVSEDANFSRHTQAGGPKRNLLLGLEKKEGPDAHEGMDALQRFVADASPEQFRAEWEARLSAREYEDWWLFSLLVYAEDSVSKNAYHYRARGPGARWRLIPWDLDASFGQLWNTERVDPEDRYDFTDKNRLFARLREDPALAEPLRERFQALLRGELRVGAVLGLIDAYAREVDAAARKDEARWGQAYRDFPRWSWRTDLTTHEEEVRYLQAWVRRRWELLEREPP
jgi:hypothetical protein